MKSRLYIFAALLAALLLTTASSAQAQMRMITSPAEIVAALKVGQWVKMEGFVQKDFTVRTKDVEMLTGDFLDDAWSIQAVSRNIDPNKQEFKILLMPIKTQENTEYKAKRSIVTTFNSFANLQGGMLVEVDGTYQKDGTFLALEIEDKSADLVDKPELKNEIEAVGKVEKIDEARRTVTVMGVTFHIMDNTRLRAVIK
ncbi:DUF5666 domain-containing protein [candidate division KSB1 bacterium]|nr:DUF5666 domain-containing protein [candidate division KSB1 bacterium]